MIYGTVFRLFLVMELIGFHYFYKGINRTIITTTTR